MSDRLIRILSRDGRLRGMAAVTTDLCDQLRRRHGTDPTATVALGRLTTGAALLGALLKGDQRLALAVEGNGPLGRLAAETDAAGQVRASIRQPVAGLPPRDGRFDVVGAVGRAGFLHVVKDLGLKEPYRSSVILQTSEIGDDLAWYLTTSEQVPSTVALGVRLGREAQVAAAGGFILQSLPPADEGLVAGLEERLRDYGSVSERLAAGRGPEELLAELLADIPYDIVGETPLQFRCSCSRSQSLALLRTLGREELEQLIEAQQETSVTCDYCRQVYRFSREELRQLLPPA